jgi:hypothetical protein
VLEIAVYAGFLDACALALCHHAGEISVLRVVLVVSS